MSALNQVGEWTTGHPFATLATASALAVGGGIVAVSRLKAVSNQTVRRKFSAGTLAAVAAFVICTSVSLNTSYRFTYDGLGMTGTAERILSCAAFESLIAMCVLGARERMVGPTKSPGWYGSSVWVFAALSSVPAWHEGGGFSTATVVRVIVGSFGSALAAHSALGLELRHRTGDESQSPLAQIARDLRERLMARLGLSVRNRTAQEIAQDRAMRKAVDLADRFERMSKDDRKKRPGRRCARRLGKWQQRAGLAGNDERKALYRESVAQRLYSTELRIEPEESPWHTGGTPEAVEEAQKEAGRLRGELEAAQAEAARLRGEQVRHMEELAATVEAALLAHGGTLVPGPRAEVCDNLDDEFADCVEMAEPGEAAEARRAAAAHGGQSRATARVPQQSDEDERQDLAAPEETAKDRPELRDLRDYATKKDAIQALYRSRIASDDPRTINQITEELRTELREAGIQFDRAPAHRAISELHPVEQGEAERHEHEAGQGELVRV